MVYTDIGIDLGSSNIVVWTAEKGVIIREPSMVAYDKENDKIIAYGEEAQQLVSRTTGDIVAIRPLKNGTISDYSVTEKMLRHFISMALGRRRFKKPYISICIPSRVTQVERRAVEEAAYQSGARDVTMVETTVAAAIGAGIDITKPVGSLIVDIGGGTTDIAVISIGAPVLSTTLKSAGGVFNENITRYIRRYHSLFVDESIAEEIKVRIGSAYKRPQSSAMQVSGRNVLTGLPRTISISSDEIREALADSVSEIADGVHGILEKTPPELAADIASRGIVLTGGGALLDGLTELIEERTGINTMVAENPGDCVAIGCGRYVELMDTLGRMEY